MKGQNLTRTLQHIVSHSETLSKEREVKYFVTTAIYVKSLVHSFLFLFFSNIKKHLVGGRQKSRNF